MSENTYCHSPGKRNGKPSLVADNSFFDTHSSSSFSAVVVGGDTGGENLTMSVGSSRLACAGTNIGNSVLMVCCIAAHTNATTQGCGVY